MARLIPCIVLTLGSAILFGCSGASGSTANTAVENLTAENLVVENASGGDPFADAVNSSAPSAVPAHRYQYKEGDLYGYLGAVSEDQKKAGVATPSVVMFRYAGYWGGENHLDLVSDQGNVVESAECTVPCVAIRRTFADGSVDRVGYTPDSVIGSAFLDAMNGQLERSPAVGSVNNGYRFRGGDPDDPSNWRSLTPPAEPQTQNLTAENLVVENTD